jgi:hypothetical protein
LGKQFVKAEIPKIPMPANFQIHKIPVSEAFA